MSIVAERLPFFLAVGISQKPYIKKINRVLLKLSRGFAEILEISATILWKIETIAKNKIVKEVNANVAVDKEVEVHVRDYSSDDQWNGPAFIQAEPAQQAQMIHQGSSEDPTC